ncbi:recombination protein NinG [Providencia heimbachae]|uniref:recombination protein NinG n=1 Tax=Providencia heimbachae TaxID=333962 RepID=UPI001419848B|nr:recombination protein NinG [Providencia heimbachae]NIH21838.1 recombination protein NinG [Providencia heimbachae]
MAKERRRRCKICREWFELKYQNVEWCSPEHGAELALKRRNKEREKAEQKLKKERQQKERESRDKLKIRKLAVKPLSYFAKQAQTAFNSFIRERDKDLPCISCDRFHEGQYHAGHYRTTKANPEIRFDEDNCHKQCAPCNNHLSGNIENYRPALILKIGRERFDILMGFHELPKWKRDDYERVRDDYRKKLKELKNVH